MPPSQLPSIEAGRAPITEVLAPGERKRLEGDHRAVMAALKRAPKPTAEPERRSDPSI